MMPLRGAVGYPVPVILPLTGRDGVLSCLTNFSIYTMAEDKEHLIALLRRLPAEQVAHLLEYAEFLLQRRGVPEQIPQPQEMPRPNQETVVQAIKRLSASYPMLDREKLFGETTTFMAQHLLEGRDAVAVIDELALLFRRHYDALIDSEKDTRGESNDRSRS